MSVIWRVDLKRRDVQDFLSRHLLSPCGSHQVGDVSLLRGQPHESSGFNLVVSESSESLEMKTAITSFLDAKKEALQEITQIGGSSELDVAIFVGAEETFTRAVCFSIRELTELPEAGGELSVSAYPCSED